MLFQRQKFQPEVCAGATYRRQAGPWLVETAHVLDVTEDATGIPHVRFSVAFDYPNAGKQDEEVRTLSIEGFRATFTQPVDA